MRNLESSNKNKNTLYIQLKSVMPQNNEKNAIRKKIIIPANNIKSQ
jgi:hypothetical protein